MISLNHPSIWFLLAMGVCLAGCSAQPSEADLTSDSQSLPIVSAGAGIGYQHVSSRSRFHMGNLVEQKSEFGFAKQVGTEGVFATVPRSGWVLGIPNGDASSKNVGPLTSSPETHNQRVRDYFVGAGLAEGQIANINAHASMRQGGAIGDPGSDVAVFAGYTSVISRQINGVPVAESFAWASFNANDDVIEESVYWPTIADATIQEAKAFQDFVADAAIGPAFRSALPRGITEGKIMIHHSPGDPWATDEVVVSYDILEAEVGGSGQVRHFDRHGKAFQLKHESVTPPASSPKSSGGSN